LRLTNGWLGHCVLLGNLVRGCCCLEGGSRSAAQNGGSSEKPPPPPAGGALPHGSSAGAPAPAGAAAPPPPNPPPPPPPRLTLLTLAVAYRRDGPISSTSSSTTVRFSPSLVSNDRCLSRPCTMTRAPRVSVSATFSAAWRQMLQRRNSASPSFHSPLCRSNWRGVEATVKFATAAPDGVNRSSGSAVRLPTTVMMVSPAMASASGLRGDLRGAL